MIKLVSNLGVELRLDQENVVEPLTSNALPSSLVSHSEQVLTYLLQATLKSAVYSTTRGASLGLALQNYTRCNSPYGVTQIC